MFLIIQKMSMITPVNSCLATSNIPWFMDLTFQVSIQYCSLQHWTLLPLPVTSKTGHCSCFGSISSFFLELFLYSSPVAYWAPSALRSSSFSVTLFLLILYMRFSRQECWSHLPFPPPGATSSQCSPPRPVSLRRPYRAWLIVSLN